MLLALRFSFLSLVSRFTRKKQEMKCLNERKAPLLRREEEGK